MKLAVFASLLASAAAFSINKADVAKVRPNQRQSLAVLSEGERLSYA